MRDVIRPAPPLADVIEASKVPYPNEVPFDHITFACVVWQDERLLFDLLHWVRPFFESLAVAVQESSDGTLEVARRLADIVVEDAHRGLGDATFGPLLLPQVRTPWVLKVDVDEWPSLDLLTSLSSATWTAESVRLDGLWIPFHSTIEGIEYTEQHAHLRLFKTKRGWPALLHSRPPIYEALQWHTGWIQHDRSLDKMARRYLVYCQIGRGVETWERHNREMLEHACRGVAAVKGWDFVRRYEWWPAVRSIAFEGEDPEGRD